RRHWNTLNLDPPNLRGWFKVSPIQLFHGGYALLHSVNTVPEPGDIICSLVTHLGPMIILDFNHGHILKHTTVLCVTLTLGQTNRTSLLYTIISRVHPVWGG